MDKVLTEITSQYLSQRTNDYVPTMLLGGKEKGILPFAQKQL
jgi:hypothetical protein